MKNLDTDREDYKLVDDVYLNNSDCYYDCNAQLPINENEMNFQYLECVNADFLHISLYSTEKVLSLKQNSMDNGANNEEKEIHQETSTKGLVLKELRIHLKYAYLELPKSKPVIIYRRFIKDFSKIARPLCRLLEKDTKFSFDDSGKAAFEEIKIRLVQAPIMAAPV